MWKNLQSCSLALRNQNHRKQLFCLIMSCLFCPVHSILSCPVPSSLFLPVFLPTPLAAVWVFRLTFFLLLLLLHTTNFLFLLGTENAVGAWVFRCDAILFSPVPPHPLHPVLPHPIHSILSCLYYPIPSQNHKFFVCLFLMVQGFQICLNFSIPFLVMGAIWVLVCLQDKSVLREGLKNPKFSFCPNHLDPPPSTVCPYNFFLLLFLVKNVMKQMLSMILKY